MYAAVGTAQAQGIAAGRRSEARSPACLPTEEVVRSLTPINVPSKLRFLFTSPLPCLLTRSYDAWEELRWQFEAFFRLGCPPADKVLVLPLGHA